MSAMTAATEGVRVGEIGEERSVERIGIVIEHDEPGTGWVAGAIRRRRGRRCLRWLRCRICTGIPLGSTESAAAGCVLALSMMMTSARWRGSCRDAGALRRAFRDDFELE